MWFFDDENGNGITFNDYEDEAENTVTYFIFKDDFTDEDIEDIEDEEF